jgi:large subunit ribosomal protein L9
MEVILLERVGRHGHIGDIIKVRDGYARNFLLPRGKALRATKGNKEKFEAQRAQIEARNAEAKAVAGTVAEKLNGQSFVVVRSAGEMGQLYGSVSARDIADLIVAGGFEVEKSQVVLNTPIKTIGLTTVTIALHAEVEATVTVNVARSAEEAERQARGEAVLAREAHTYEREVGPITDDEDYAGEE